MSETGTTAKRVLVVGALGKMGVQVRAAVIAHPGLELGAALTEPGDPGIGAALEEGVVVGGDAAEAMAGCDVAIDFSIPKATLANAKVAASAGVAYVTGTTGFTPAEFSELLEVGAQIPIMHANNFSVSVNVLGWLAHEAAAKLGPDFEAELFEIHHSAKRDAPSGTALFLAEKIAKGQSVSLEEKIVLERAGEIGARPEGAIGIQTLRGGDCPGEHTIYLVGHGERVELTHRSFSREHFAKGAARAAAWLAPRSPGSYSIAEMLDLR